LVPPFNKHIERVAAVHGCLHVDLYSVVVDSTGELRRALTYDGLHLNDAGYRLWAALLDKVLPEPK
jgi:lysophospholipase L1-like esterase